MKQPNPPSALHVGLSAPREVGLLALLFDTLLCFWTIWFAFGHFALLLDYLLCLWTICFGFGHFALLLDTLRFALDNWLLFSTIDLLLKLVQTIMKTKVTNHH